MNELRQQKIKEMERIFSVDQFRTIAVSILSSVMAYFTPTKGFIIALAVMFSFNIWCGMRANGVSISTCRNFSWQKFKHALMELLLYLIIIEVLYTFMRSVGDGANAIVVIKTITYVFSYVYLQNALKNRIHAYPKNRSFRIIYHIIRFEFKRAMPAHVQEVIERIDKETETNHKS